MAANGENFFKPLAQKDICPVNLCSLSQAIVDNRISSLKCKLEQNLNFPGPDIRPLARKCAAEECLLLSQTSEHSTGEAQQQTAHVSAT